MPQSSTDDAATCHRGPDLAAATPSVSFSSGFVLAIVGTFLFALKSIFIKLAFAAGAEPTLLLTLRMVIAAPFYLWVLAKLPSSIPKESNDRALLVKTFALGFLGYYLASYLDLLGLQYISAQLERLTLFTHPAIVAVLAWMFLGENLNLRVIAAIALCYCGIALMYSQESSAGENENVALGVALVAAAAFSYSLYVILAKPTMKKIGSRRFTSVAMIGSTAFVCAHYLATRDLSQFASTPRQVYFYASIIAFVCTVIPSFLINAAILKIGATRTAIVGSAGPVITMLLAIVVLGESSSVGHFVGMGIAIVGVSLVAKSSK